MDGFPSYPSIGGRYDPGNDSWAATGTKDAPSGRYNHTAIWTGREMIVWGGAPLTRYTGLYYPYSSPTQWVSVKGRIMFDGTPLCAAVIANGQSTFSCSGGGAYDMTVPLNSKGEVKLFTFASGFAPYEAVLSPHDALDHTVRMERSGSERSLNVSYMLEDTGEPSRRRIYGSVEFDLVPVCSLVLANGQSMFSCGVNLGQYNLSVPISASDDITLDVFAAGFQPHREVLFVP